MDDLVAWLRAALDDDEAAARLCAEMFPPPWDVADRGWRVRIYASDVPEENFFSDDPDALTTRHPVVMEVEPDRHIDDPHWLSERVEHIIRHDPASVLRDVAAKRAIVDELTRVDKWDGDGVGGHNAYALAEAILRHLAAAYGDRPGWREEWRPQ